MTIAREIMSALDNHLESYQSSDIAWTNASYEIKEGVPHLKPRMTSRTRRPLGAGENSVEMYEGVYTVEVNWPANEGSDPADSKADEVAAHFPRGTTLVTTSGKSVVVTHADPINGFENPPDWYKVPVRVFWYLYNLP